MDDLLGPAVGSQPSSGADASLGALLGEAPGSGGPVPSSSSPTTMTHGTPSATTSVVLESGASKVPAKESALATSSAPVVPSPLSASARARPTSASFDTPSTASKLNVREDSKGFVQHRPLKRQRPYGQSRWAFPVVVVEWAGSSSGSSCSLDDRSKSQGKSQGDGGQPARKKASRR
jgi:hypothetical protein